jgi:hypothetical protein
MEPTSRTHLEAQVLEKVTALLTPSDLPYLCSLSRANFVHVLTHALSLLHLYRHDDADARATLSALVEEHTDRWRTGLRQDGTAGAT